MSETKQTDDGGIVARLTQMARDKALSIGAAWNALDEAATRIEELERELAAANERINSERQAAIAIATACGLSGADMTGLSGVVEAVRVVCGQLSRANEARAEIGPLKARIAELNALLDMAIRTADTRTIERDEALVAADFANLACERKEAARVEAVALAERLRYAIPAGCSEATEI
jgi:hypothetical protein